MCSMRLRARPSASCIPRRKANGPAQTHPPRARGRARAPRPALMTATVRRPRRGCVRRTRSCTRSNGTPRSRARRGSSATRIASRASRRRRWRRGTWGLRRASALFPRTASATSRPTVSLFGIAPRVLTASRKFKPDAA
eukprot:Amastigsp_a509638_393.p3 type:complete len:139 gc:universal Amastigsp_a509638_393:431-15(-)